MIDNGRRNLLRGAATLAVAAPVLATGGVALADPPRKGREPENLTDLQTEIKTYKSSGAWDTQIAAVADEALTYLKHRLRHGVRKPAVVFDIDDTALSTYDEETGTSTITGSGFGYYGPLWNYWAYEVKEFPAIAANLELAKYALGTGVDVFYVTGRRESTATSLNPSTFATTKVTIRTETIADLNAKGYTVADDAHLYLRPTGDTNASVVPYKSGARASIEAKGYDIVLNIGDQRSDLDGGHADRAFKVPNPMYKISWSGVAEAPGPGASATSSRTTSAKPGTSGWSVPCAQASATRSGSASVSGTQARSGRA